MKTAVITGASSGLGREFVRQTLERYPGLEEIWVIARRQERLMELREELGEKIRIFVLDLTALEDQMRLAEELQRRNPQVKILVNAAGYGKIGKFTELKLAGQTGMVRLNCEALCAITYLVLPYMSDNGRILQIASAAAFLPQPRFAVYAASKSFVLSFARALNEELRNRRIYVTAVCPGPVDTEFFDVAETTHKMSAYKQLTMANPVLVVKEALTDADGGKPLSIHKALMKAFYPLSRLIPHRLLLLFLR